MATSKTTGILRTTLALSMLGAGTAKVTKQDAMLESAEHLGYSAEAYQAIGAAELAGGVGLLAGAKSKVIGIAANVGAVAVLTGAVIEHLRAGDGPEVYGPAAVLDALAIVTLARQLGECGGGDDGR